MHGEEYHSREGQSFSSPGNCCHQATPKGRHCNCRSLRLQSQHCLQHTEWQCQHVECSNTKASLTEGIDAIDPEWTHSHRKNSCGCILGCVWHAVRRTSS